MKKILIVTECFYPEEFKINDVALEWKKKGYDVHVLTTVPTYPASKVFDGFENKWYQKNVYQGITVYRVKAVTGYKNSLFKKLLKYFSFMLLGSFVSLSIGKKYDYVFGFSMSALTGMIPAVLLQKMYKKPVTLWALDIWPDSVYAYGFKKTKLLEFFLNHLVKFIYRNTSNFAISSKGFEDKIKSFLDEEKAIQYLPNWADTLDKTLEPFKFSENKKIQLTFAGNIGKVQNLEKIIIAFATLPQKLIEKAQLNIIGDGSHLETLQKLVIDNSFKNIIFFGKKPREEMYKYFSGSDFLIVSLINKPIFTLTVPAKTQTYIAANKPIIGIINGEASDLIKEYNLGFTAAPDDLAAIQSVIIDAINTDPLKIKEFTKNADTLTKTLFAKENIINSLLDLLTQQKR